MASRGTGMNKPRLAQEIVPEGEDRHVQALLDCMHGLLLSKPHAGAMPRDVHIKMHGLVKAEFEVDTELPDELRVGLFGRPGRYPAWIRFSNADSSNKPDSARDIRGMAIKVMGVDGDKLLPGEKHAPTQDFVLISTDVFATRDVRGFLGLARAIIGSIWLKLWFFLTHPRVAWYLLCHMRRFANPLQIRYFSTTPYLFGARAVKYSATPRSAARDAMPEPAGDNHLRHTLAHQLQRGEVWFDFAVQFQTDAERMPIEDPRKRWSEARSPFVKVASLRLPQQDCDTPTRRTLGENLSFTPWHALPEHRPLGGVNRARRVIYEAISSLRHGRNEVRRSEPHGWDD